MQNVNAILKEMYMNQYNISRLPLPSDITPLIKPLELKSPRLQSLNLPKSAITDTPVIEQSNGSLNFALTLAGIGIGILIIYAINQSISNDKENQKRKLS